MTSDEVGPIRYEFGSAFLGMRTAVECHGEGSARHAEAKARVEAASRALAPLCDRLRDGEALDCSFAAVVRLPGGILYVLKIVPDAEIARRMPVPPPEAPSPDAGPEFIGAAHVGAVESAEFPWLAESLATEAR